MGVSGQRHVPAALCPGERTHGTHCTGGWVGPRAGLDTEATGKILCYCRGSNPDRPVVQSVARHYTAWATPAHMASNKHVLIHALCPHSKQDDYLNILLQEIEVTKLFLTSVHKTTFHGKEKHTKILCSDNKSFYCTSRSSGGNKWGNLSQAPSTQGPLPKAFYKKKSKAVPLHAMEALGGRGGIAPTHSRPRH
jgi:hypothetical protein